MRLRADQLTAHLGQGQGLAPVYLVYGDEPLLAEECCQAIRERARERGYDERQVLTVEPGFDWNQIITYCQSLSLFAERRLLELRLPKSRPGDVGAKTLIQFAEAPPEDVCLLVLAGKMDKQLLASRWVKSLEKAGAVIGVYPLEAAQLPGWIDQCMRRQGLEPGPGVTEMLAYHFEGNLLAAAQEVEKLGLLFDNGPVSVDDIQDKLSDNARFNVFGLADACLRGDGAGVIRILHGLKAEGVTPVLVLWALAREIRLLSQLATDLATGQSEEQVFRAFRIWSRRRPLIKKALKRMRPTRWLALLQGAARVDRVIKGRAPGEAWQALQALSLTLCGVRLRARR